MLFELDDECRGGLRAHPETHIMCGRREEVP